MSDAQFKSGDAVCYDGRMWIVDGVDWCATAMQWHYLLNSVDAPGYRFNVYQEHLSAGVYARLRTITDVVNLALLFEWHARERAAVEMREAAQAASAKAAAQPWWNECEPDASRALKALAWDLSKRADALAVEKEDGNE